MLFHHLKHQSGLLKPLTVLLVLVAVSLSGCAGQTKTAEPVRIQVAEQYGLAYAPLQIMKEQGFLQDELVKRSGGRPIELSWVKLANTAAIQEAMLADTLDVAFVAIPPFLLGRDQGMPWSIFTGLSTCPVELVCNDPTVTSLSDLVGKGKIAVPQPGSIQHILLAMAAEKTFGDATAFDRQLVSMKHPDGLQALLAGQDIVAQFTSPPYNFMAAEADGITVLLDGETAAGEPFSFIVGIAQPEFLEDDIRLAAFQAALDRSFSFIVDEPEATTRLLAELFELDQPTTRTYLYDRGIAFGPAVQGVENFARFMERSGYLERTYQIEDVVWTTP